MCTHKIQAGSRLELGCIDQIFTLWQVLEYRHVFRRSTISDFLYMKAAFDSVFWHWLLLRGCVRKIHSTNPISVCEQPKSSSSSWICFTREVMFTRIALFSLYFSILSLRRLWRELYLHLRVQVPLILFSRKSFWLTICRPVMLLIEDQGKFQFLLSLPWDTLSMFGMHSTPSHCKILLQNWAGSKSNLVLAGNN